MTLHTSYMKEQVNLASVTLPPCSRTASVGPKKDCVHFLIQLSKTFHTNTVVLLVTNFLIWCQCRCDLCSQFWVENSGFLSIPEGTFKTLYLKFRSCSQKQCGFYLKSKNVYGPKLWSFILAVIFFSL